MTIDIKYGLTDAARLTVEETSSGYSQSPVGDLPSNSTEHSAGLDVMAFISGTGVIKIEPGQTKMISTGFKFSIPPSWCFKVYNRSSNFKRGFMLPNNVGIIDSDYRGELFVPLWNFSDKQVLIENRQRIAQLMLEKVHDPRFVFDQEEFSSFNKTERHEGGFGSTGK